MLSAARGRNQSSADWQSAVSPTVMEDGRLDADARTDDAWGNRFRIICDGPRTTVRSAGPDGRAGTPDDLKVVRGSG